MLDAKQMIIIHNNTSVVFRRLILNTGVHVTKHTLHILHTSTSRTAVKLEIQANHKERLHLQVNRIKHIGK
jgi:hypothetical protein